MAENQPTFEENLKELEALVEQIETGQVGLEESIRKYERGMKLVARCRTMLTEAEQRVQKLQPGADDQTASQPIADSSSDEQHHG